MFVWAFLRFLTVWIIRWLLMCSMKLILTLLTYLVALAAKTTGLGLVHENAASNPYLVVTCLSICSVWAPNSKRKRHRITSRKVSTFLRIKVTGEQNSSLKDQKSWLGLCTSRQMDPKCQHSSDSTHFTVLYSQKNDTFSKLELST